MVIAIMATNNEPNTRGIVPNNGFVKSCMFHIVPNKNLYIAIFKKNFTESFRSSAVIIIAIITIRMVEAYNKIYIIVSNSFHIFLLHASII
ncbi:hypothetical protein CAXC1_230002 [Candidatus Xenohaliotis californiensis]|uniref:Uncharacterized protein n=1 Tax=Candidatus Xenohaliotis californiensis TaxID=84677 RepID=A0ABP0ESL4_9RICK|nr:hypothetical protein CAXC1_230002 [Candidatus Xenohaliotis californiensis]